jgi:hypothetical protein
MQPVATSRALGERRRSARTALRLLAAAEAVTVQVFTTTTSAAPEVLASPADSSIWARASPSYWFTLQPSETTRKLLMPAMLSPGRARRKP